MPTLSIVRKDIFKFLKYGGVVLAIIILAVVLIRVLLIIKEIIIPSAPPAPTVKYGKLPKIFFPEGVSREFTYSINTISGDLPNFGSSSKVYKMMQEEPDILAVEKASERVSKEGFNPKPQQISDFVFQWKNPEPPQQNLIMNTRLAEFNLSSSFLNYQEKLATKNFSEKSEPVEAATTFLQSLGFYPDDIDTKRTKVDFSHLTDGVIKPTSKVRDSNIATVYFYQNSKDDTPIVYPQGAFSSMRMMVGAGDLMGKILDGKFSHQKILDESSTYPIKTSQEAFEELKNGKGYVATYSGNGDKIVIKKVYIGLYSEGRIQKYITPVIVFEGNDNFVAYVPAVKDEWIDK